MKKLLLILITLFFWAGSSVGQTQYTVVPTEGASGNTNGTGGDPVCRYYNSIRYQVVYTVAELTAAGMPANLSISRLAWNVTESSVSLGNYTINMGHTAATNSATHNVDANTTVKNAFTYGIATGYNDIIFDQPFIWNGTSNIVVEICTGPSNPYTSPYGGVQAKTGVTSGSRQYRVDGSSACAVATSVVNLTKPYIRFTGTVASGPSNPTSFAATTTSTDQIDLGWALNGNSNPVMLVWNSSNTFGTPVDGTIYNVNDEIPGGGLVLQKSVAVLFNHIGLNPGTTYYYKAFSVDGSNTYSGGVTANATTWVCDPASQCNFSVTMIDGYGDGWDGTVLGFKQNGILVGTFGNGFTSGATYGPVNIPLCPNLPTEIVVVNLGSYVGEKGFTVYAPYGVVIFDWPTEGSFTASTVFSTFFSVCSLPAVDLTLSEFYQNTGLFYKNGVSGIHDYAVQLNSDYEKPWIPTAMLTQSISGVMASEVNNSVLIPNTGKSSESTLLSAIEVNAVVENLGLDAASYILNWDVDGVSQPSYTGPSIDPEGSDMATLNYTPAERGTFFVNGDIDVADDENIYNNVNQFRLLVYPDTYTRTIYDRGDNIVDTWVGFNSASIALKAAVRYTAADYIKPIGVDFICQTEEVTSGTYTVELRAAGATTSAPGAVIYSKDFTAPVYFSEGGVYLHFAFDENEIPTIAPGSDYWIAVQCPLGVLYPGAVHNTGFTAGRSFLYVASTDSWSPLVITTERAWMMRSVQVQGDLPACLAPTAQSVANITVAGAELSWASADSFFDVYVVPAGDPAPEAETTPTANDVTNPYSWTGGQGGESYDWYVRTDCGQNDVDVSDWAGPNQFSTINVVPFFDGFETGNTNQALINGWTQESVTGSYNWTANNSLTDYNRTPRTGLWNAYLHYSDAQWMFKAIELTGGQTYNFSMFARQDGAIASNASIKVSYGISANAAAMTNPIVPLTGIINGTYQEISGSFTPESNGIYYIGILGTINGTPWYISIDDISLVEASNATLSWYNLQWPDVATIDVSQNATIYAQCWEAEVTPAAGPGEGIECWIGYNNADTDPSTWENWIPATYNFTNDPSNNDEYMAELGANQSLAIGTYYYASRFRYQNGPFTFGGYAGGAWDGTSNVSGVLTITPLPNDNCEGAFSVTCGNTYLGSTTSATLDNPGTCNGNTVTAPGVWYKITGNNQWIEAGLCSALTNYDTKISVYSGDCNSLVCVTSDDDGCDPGTASIVKWMALSGVDYFILVHGYSSNTGNFELSINCIAAPALATWTGASSSSWVLASNWDTDVPGPETDVVIPGGLSTYPTITTAGWCNNFTMNSGASFIGSEFLTVNGTTTIERSITGYTSGTDGWHLISSPVVSQPISGDWTPASGYDFYALDESKTLEYWLNQKNHPEMTNFIPGQGYLVAYETAGVKTFTGALNSTPLTLSGLTNSGGEYGGWHLVGNPFTSAINAALLTKTNIGANVQVWNSGAASYEVSSTIPALNGFMVETTGSGELTIPLTSRVHSSVSWFKSTEDQILLRANDPAGHTSQLSIVRFNPEATEAYDVAFDSHYLAGFAPMFYSKSAGEGFALNTLPQLTNETVIPFEFIKNGSNDFNIEMLQAVPGAIIYLTDKKTNTITNLMENPVYSFSAVEGDITDRFLLTFGSVGIDNPNVSQIDIYGYQDVIFVKGAKASSEVVVTNLLGQVMISTAINGDGVNTINARNLSDGIYLVSVISGNSVVSKKVVLQK